MNVAKYLIILIYLTQLFITHSYGAPLVVESKKASNVPGDATNKCIEIPDKKILKGGWYLWEPYQFNKITAAGYSLIGMDIELVKSIAQRVGVSIDYSQVSWKQHQDDLRSGVRDIASGATYSNARAEYVYFSEPYRYEENSLFTMSRSDKDLHFDNILEFLAQVRLQNFILGVTKGFIYADPQINLFIKDEANQDIIIEYDNDVDALEALIHGEIDGFISDRVVGAAAVLNQKANSSVKEVQLNIKTPIHLMFSKKSMSLDLVDKFNHEIKAFSMSSEYKKIVKTYLYPVMLMQTIGSEWFYFLGVIGTIAFAISGIAIGAKDNATLFATFLLAMIPSVGGGIIRDVITNQREVGIFLTPSYMYYIIIVVLIGFAMVRLLEYYNNRANEDGLVDKFWDNILIICDAIGQAAFIVTGVAIVIMAKIEPIGLWGPFFGFLASNGGVILRDMIRKKRVISCMVGTFNAEIGIIWSFIFSIYLDINSYDPSPTGIRNMVIIVATGCFLTRLMSYYFKVPNITFSNEDEVVEKSL